MVRSRRKQQNDIRTHCCRGWKEDAVQAGPLNVIGQNGSRIFRRYTEQARRKMRRFLTDVKSSPAAPPLCTAQMIGIPSASKGNAATCPAINPASNICAASA